MSHFRCSLCGLLRGTRTYDPRGFENDIQLVTMTSLGRGKGFKVAGESPIEEDHETFQLIKNRIAILHEHYTNQKKPDSDNLVRIIKSLEDQLSAYKIELNTAKNRLSELEEEGLDTEEELLDEIEEALQNDYEDSFSDLPSAVKALISEYQDLLEESNDLIGSLQLAS